MGKEQWESRLAELTKAREGALVTVEVLDSEYGANEEVERLPFSAAAYDPRDDVVIISIGGKSPGYPVVLRHMVWHPTEVDVDEKGVKVVEPDGTTTLVAFY